MLIFVPLSTSALADWARRGVRAPVEAHAATPSFLAAFDLAATDGEDAERTALHVGALAALLSGGARLVAVAEAAQARDLGDDVGRVRVDSLPWASVTALFADEPAAAARVADAATALAGLDLEAAWDDEAAEALLDSADLLWHGPEEWQALIG